MRKLDEIDSFGSSDADTDEFLLECFEDHAAYNSVRNHKKYLILGRKGAGKTAIFKKILSEKSEHVFAEGYSFSDYPWHVHEKQKQAGVPENECYKHSWQYIMLITMAKLLVKKGNSNRRYIKELERFLEDSYGTTSPELTNIFASKNKLKIMRKMELDFKLIKCSTSGEYVDMEELPLIIHEVNSYIRKCVMDASDDNCSYYIMFDELDRNYDANSADYSRRMSSLLIAARDFNNYFMREGKKVTAVIFLRDDIFNNIQFEDKNKIYMNSTSVVAWDSNNGHNKLKNMMEKRFYKLLNVDSWDMIFDESKRMTGKQSKYQHILDRTFKRPRDMIVYCNNILKSHNSSERRTEKFNNDDVKEAREGYSDYLKREIDDEMQSHIKNHDFYFGIIQRIGCMTFSKTAFENAYRSVKTENKEEDRTYQKILKDLFDFSVISFQKVGGTGGGSRWVWKYEEMNVEFDDGATKFKVHNGLKEVLRLTQREA